MLAGGGCSSGDPGTDGGTGDRRLEIVTPGRSVGVVPGKHRTLGVRYTDQSAGPVANQRIDFAIFGDPQGSTLSADGAVSDGDGIAQVTVNAGAVAASFVVRVSAPGADDVVFDIEVSAAGFGALVAGTTYQGTLPREKLTRVEFLLYSGTRCQALDLAAPAAPLRQRGAEAVGEVARFGALALDRDYTLLVRGIDSSEILRATGCAEVPHDKLKADRDAELQVHLSDVLPPLEGIYQLVSELRLPAASRPLVRVLRPWEDLGDCRNDPAQLLLDCITDALDPGDPLDCVVVDPSPAAQAIAAERGTLSGTCRGDLTARGSASLDLALRVRMQSSGAMRKTLGQLASDASSVLRSFSVQSTLELEGADRSGQLVARHRVDSIRFAAGGSTQTYEAVTLGLFDPVAAPVAARVTEGRLQIGEHRLSAGFGTAGRRALGALVLEPVGLPADSVALAFALAELAELARDGQPPLRGCEAIEGLVCAAARLDARCLGSACGAGLGALAAYLDLGFLDLERPASQLVLAGSAVVTVAGADPWRVERLGSADAPGTWTAGSLRLAGEVVELEQGRFIGEPVPQD